LGRRAKITDEFIQRVLRYLEEVKRPPSARDLAARFASDGSEYMTRKAIDFLEKDGKIERERGKARSIRLTDRYAAEVAARKRALSAANHHGNLSAGPNATPSPEDEYGGEPFLEGQLVRFSISGIPLIEFPDGTVVHSVPLRHDYPEHGARAGDIALVEARLAQPSDKWAIDGMPVIGLYRPIRPGD
jgi:hypothetical protein